MGLEGSQWEAKEGTQRRITSRCKLTQECLAITSEMLRGFALVGENPVHAEFIAVDIEQGHHDSAIRVEVAKDYQTYTDEWLTRARTEIACHTGQSCSLIDSSGFVHTHWHSLVLSEVMGVLQAIGDASLGHLDAWKFSWRNRGRLKLSQIEPRIAEITQIQSSFFSGANLRQLEADLQIEAYQATAQWERSPRTDLGAGQPVIEDVVAVNDARNKFCFELWQHHRSLKEINVALKKHPDFEEFDDERSVRGPINVWGKHTGVKPRRGQPGRPRRK